MLSPCQASPQLAAGRDVAAARRFALAALVLVVAAVVRLAGLDRVPPGLQHDEVFGAVFAESVFAGHWPMFLDANGGNEPLFLYGVTAAMAAFGRNVVALRWPAAAAGLIGVCASYRLARQLLGWRHAVLAAAMMACSLWHILDSRVSLRAICLPATATLAAVFLWRWLATARLRWWALGSAFLGLSLYTYTSAALVPASVACFGLVLLLRRSDRRAGAGLVAAATLAAAIGLPLALHMAAVPLASARIRDLSYELNQLRSGNALPVLANAAKVLGMFAVTGDPEWRYNVAGRPVFTPAVGLAFYVGVLVAARRWKQRQYAFLLLWIVVNLGASVATGSAPSSLRAVGAMPAVFCLVAIGCWWTHDRLCVLLGSARLAQALLAAALIWEAGDSLVSYFVVWPANSQVRDVYRADLATAARCLRDADAFREVLVSSEYAADLDRQSFQYLGFTDVEPRWFDAAHSLIVPSGGATLLLPTLRPLAASLQPLLAEMGDLREVTPDLEVWSLAATDSAAEGWLADVATDWSTQAVRIESVALPESVIAGGAVDVVVHWRVTAQAPGGRSLTLFAHLRDTEGRLWSQADVLAYPSSDWRVGDEVYQLLRVPVPADMPPGKAVVQVGIYEDPSRPLALFLRASGVVFSRLEAGDVAVTVGEAAAEEAIMLELPLGAQVGGARLVGARVEPRILQPGGTVDVSLWWQGASYGDTAASFVLTRDTAELVLGAAAPLPATLDGQERTLRQRTTLAVPRQLERGEWRLTAVLESGAVADLGDVFAAGIERTYEAPAPAIGTNAYFEGGPVLVGADLASEGVAAGGDSTVTLYWTCTQALDDSYTVFVQLVAADGTVVASGDGVPADGLRPTTGWLPGETIADTHVLAVGAQVPAGSYSVVVGLYRADEPGYPRLALRSGGDAVTIAQIEVTG